jgi:glucose-6-phosphate 1-dehydrogenase
VVEETWRVLQPLLDQPPVPMSYKSGSWGPTDADRLTHGHTGWHKPWMPGDNGNGKSNGHSNGK